MRPTPRIPDDPTVAEVRRWRARLTKEAGGTLKGLMDLVNARAAERRRSGAKPGPRVRRGKTRRAT